MLLLFCLEAPPYLGGHAVIGQHVAVTSSSTMAGVDTHAAADPTMFFISLVVGATVIVLIWLMRRSKDQSGDTREKSGEYNVIMGETP